MSTVQPNDFSGMAAELFVAIDQLTNGLGAAFNEIKKQNEIIRDQAKQIFELQDRLARQDEINNSLLNRINNIDHMVIRTAVNQEGQANFVEAFVSAQIPTEMTAEIKQLREAKLAELEQLQRAYVEEAMQTPGLTYNYAPLASSSLPYEHKEARAISETNIPERQDSEVNTSDNQDVEDEYSDAYLAKQNDEFAAFLDAQKSENSKQKPSEAPQESSINQDVAVTVHTENDLD